MPAKLGDLLGSVRADDPILVEGLQVFGLYWDTDSALSYSVLDEALSAGTLEVGEVSREGVVQELRVANKGEEMVFLMAGEQLVGGMQNRILNASMMVGGQSRLDVPVSCVERGRWRYSSLELYGSGSSSHGAMRARSSKSSTGGYRSTGRPISDQSAVWAEVDRKLTMMGSMSPSDALEQAYEDHQAKLEDAVHKVRLPDGCHGVAFAWGGRIVGLDLFDSPATLSKLLPKLVKAYAIDALEAPASSPAVQPDAVIDWLRNASATDAEPFDSPGLGADLRFEGDNVVGACLLVEDRPVHLELFQDETPGRSSS